MKRLLFLFCLFVAMPAQAAPLPDIDTVVACVDPSPTPPDFTGPTCRSMPLREVDSQGRQLWIRATVMLPADLPDPIGVRIAAMASSAFWWNGVAIGANGRPAATAAAERAGRMDAMIALPPALVHRGANTVVVRLSSWHQPWRVARPVQQIAIEHYADPTLRTLRQYLLTLMTSGVFALAALYFGAAWVTDRRDKGSLALAALAVATLVQLAAEVSRGMVAYAYPWQEPRLALVMAAAGCVGVAMVGYAGWHYRRRQIRIWIAGSAAAMMITAALPGGMDRRTLLLLALGALLAILAAIPEARGHGEAARRARATIAALALFALLLVLQPAFLDTTLYLVLAALSAVLFADQILTLRRAEQDRAATAMRAARLELALLRQSIAPHFLLNTLNALAEWVEIEPEKGVRMIELLADEFRTVADIAGRPLIALVDEIALCDAHLALMAYRTDAGLALRVEGDPIGLDVPPGVLLTLVENALVHGRYADGDAFVLRIDRVGDRADGRLRALDLVTPPSRAPEGRGAIGSGSGLAYIRARIAEAFGADAVVTAGPTEEQAWRTTITTGAAA